MMKVRGFAIIRAREFVMMEEGEIIGVEAKEFIMI